MYVYIYILINIYLYVYIYIYVNQFAKPPEPGEQQSGTVKKLKKKPSEPEFEYLIDDWWFKIPGASTISKEQRKI